MFDWLKRKELDKIDTMQTQLHICNSKIMNLESDIRFLEDKLRTAVKIANGKKVVRCDAKKCMDYENGTCTLGELCIKTDGRDAFCMDYDAGSVMDELKQEIKGNVSSRAPLNLILNETA